ncbi:hypothetical protein ACFW1P_32880 [Paenibacillus sp. NPDC058910]|uniref:hypothetical protein n=1 Tax=unclassified Paenibacillus TaxID=185978 RepID=UPI00367701FD
MSAPNKYLEFRSKFDCIDEKKLELEKLEMDTHKEYLSWAENHFTRDVREIIIQVCIEKKLPEWRVNELKNSHEKWERSKENLTRADIALFAEVEMNHTDFQPEKKDKISKMMDFLNWRGK